MKLENARYSKIALTLKLTLSVPVNTVSFSTVFFFFFHILLLFFRSLSFSGLLSTFLLLATRAPTIGDTSTYDW